MARGVHAFTTFPSVQPRFVRGVFQLRHQYGDAVTIFDTREVSVNRFAAHHRFHQLSVDTTYDGRPLFGSMLAVANRHARADASMAMLINADLLCEHVAHGVATAAQRHLGGESIIIAQRYDVSDAGVMRRHAANGYDVWLWNATSHRLPPSIPPFRFGINNFDTWFLASMLRANASVVDATRCLRCVHADHHRAVASYAFYNPMVYNVHAFVNRYLALHAQLPIEDGHPCQAQTMCTASGSLLRRAESNRLRCVYAHCSYDCWRRRERRQWKHVRRIPTRIREHTLQYLEEHGARPLRARNLSEYETGVLRGRAVYLPS